MRKILFKAKHIHVFLSNEHLNNRWIEGYLSDENYIHSPELEGEFLIDPETVCQYTDSIDIGRKKIFEHDIVEEKGTIGIVKFGKYGNGFHLGYFIDWINCPHLRNELSYWEGKVRVIGNIFDNPELLKRD